jgi:hypothetical protein
MESRAKILVENSFLWARIVFWGCEMNIAIFILNFLLNFFDVCWGEVSPANRNIPPSLVTQPR